MTPPLLEVLLHSRYLNKLREGLGVFLLFSKLTRLKLHDLQGPFFSKHLLIKNKTSKNNFCNLYNSTTTTTTTTILSLPHTSFFISKHNFSRNQSLCKYSGSSRHSRMFRSKVNVWSLVGKANRC